VANQVKGRSDRQGSYLIRVSNVSHGRSKLELSTTWLLTGRALFGGVFLYNGLTHFTRHAMMAAYAASKGVPSPAVAVAVGGILLIAGGLSLLSGAWPRTGTVLIVAFLVIATPTMHDFWNASDGGVRLVEFTNFVKNIGLLGGACIAAALPEPWPGSVLARRRIRYRSAHRPM